MFLAIFVGISKMFGILGKEIDDSHPLFRASRQA